MEIVRFRLTNNQKLPQRTTQQSAFYGVAVQSEPQNRLSVSDSGTQNAALFVSLVSRVCEGEPMWVRNDGLLVRSG